MQEDDLQGQIMSYEPVFSNQDEVRSLLLNAWCPECDASFTVNIVSTKEPYFEGAVYCYECIKPKVKKK